MRSGKIFGILIAVFVLALSTSSIAAKPSCPGGTTVPGQCAKSDADNNGYPDAGVYVSGHYTSVYAYDNNGQWYWDLGDGRIEGTVGSIAALDQATLTQCDYEVNYRADFGNDPYMNNGWIINNITCRGYGDNNHYTYLIVSNTDPRYTGNPAWSVWGNWEYHVDVEGRQGNLVRPDHAVGS